MSHLRLTTVPDEAEAPGTDAAFAPSNTPAADAPPGPGAVRFAGFTPMNDQPAFADRKAGFVIGAGGLLLSTALFFAMPLTQFARPGVWPAVTLALALGLAAALLTAVRTAYRCVVLAAPPRPGNLLFVQNISAAGAGAYADAVRAATARSALRDVLAYNHAMATLGAAKYRLAGRALLCLRVAIPLWLLLLVLVTVRAG